MKHADGDFDYSHNAQTAHTGVQAAQVLADASYRIEAVMTKLAKGYPGT